MTYVQIDPNTRPLCPNSFEPVHPSHLLRNRVLDLFYEAAPKDDDGEMAEAVGGAYHAAAYGKLDDHMDLFRADATAVQPGNPLVTAWWFRCQVCGFVLPAQQVPR